MGWGVRGWRGKDVQVGVHNFKDGANSSVQHCQRRVRGKAGSCTHAVTQYARMSPTCEQLTKHPAQHSTAPSAHLAPSHNHPAQHSSAPTCGQLINQPAQHSRRLCRLQPPQLPTGRCSPLRQSTLPAWQQGRHCSRLSWLAGGLRGGGCSSRSVHAFTGPSPALYILQPAGASQGGMLASAQGRQADDGQMVGRRGESIAPILPWC